MKNTKGENDQFSINNEQSIPKAQLPNSRGAGGSEISNIQNAATASPACECGDNNAANRKNYPPLEGGGLQTQANGWAQSEIRNPQSEIFFPLEKRPLPGGRRVRIMINHCNTYTYGILSRVKNAQYRAKRSKNLQQLGTTRKKPAISQITRNGRSKVTGPFGRPGVYCEFAKRLLRIRGFKILQLHAIIEVTG